jgi:hypothetical protein
MAMKGSTALGPTVARRVRFRTDELPAGAALVALTLGVFPALRSSLRPFARPRFFCSDTPPLYTIGCPQGAHSRRCVSACLPMQHARVSTRVPSDQCAPRSRV